MPISRKETFDEALKHLRKKGTFTRKIANITRVIIGVPGIDWLLGRGFPRGRIVELYGFESSGKTTTAATIVKAFQAMGERAIFLDYEHTADLNYFEKIGVNLDPDIFLFDQPFCLEHGMEAAIKLIKTGEIGLLVVDSVASMQPKAELEGQVTDETVALQARKMGRVFRTLISLLNKTKTGAIFLNHQREKIGSYGNPTTTPGGRALKFYSTVRIEAKRVEINADTGLSTNRLVLRKQKSYPLLTGTTEFKIGPTGIRTVEHTLQSMVDIGVLKKEGGKYFLGDDCIAKNEKVAAEVIKERGEEFSELLFKAWETRPS